MGKSIQSKRLVLYADDDSDDHQFVREAFLSYEKDIELKIFSSAMQLLDFIHRRKRSETLPCLVIPDINLPDMDGKAALKFIRKMNRYHNVPVVLFTISSARMICGLLPNIRQVFSQSR